MSDAYSFGAVAKQPTGLPSLEMGPLPDPVEEMRRRAIQLGVAQPGGQQPNPIQEAARKAIIGGLGNVSAPFQHMYSAASPGEFLGGLGDAMISAAGPKLPPSLAALFLSARPQFEGNVISHKIMDELGKKVGEVTLQKDPIDPANAFVTFIRSTGEKSGLGPLGGDPGVFGNKEMLSLVRDFKKKYPEIETLTGSHRISGASRGGAADVGGYGYKPIRLRPPAPQTPETKWAKGSQQAIQEYQQAVEEPWSMEPDIGPTFGPRGREWPEPVLSPREQQMRAAEMMFGTRSAPYTTTRGYEVGRPERLPPSRGSYEQMARDVLAGRGRTPWEDVNQGLGGAGYGVEVPAGHRIQDNYPWSGWSTMLGPRGEIVAQGRGRENMFRNFRELGPDRARSAQPQRQGLTARELLWQRRVLGLEPAPRAHRQPRTPEEELDRVFRMQPRGSEE